MVYVEHSGVGDLARGELLVALMRPEIVAAEREGPIAVIYHDVTKMTNANEAYARQVGELAKEMGPKNKHYIAFIDRTYLRVLGRMAALIGGVKVTFAKTQLAATAALDEAGISQSQLDLAMAKKAPAAAVNAGEAAV